MIQQVFTDRERRAWAPPEDITVSEWAERYRVLPRQSAMPGPWRSRLTPYVVGVMDAYNDPRVEQITIMASVQSAKTESAYNMLGYAICQDPAPALVVMPTNKTLKKVNKRLQSMILASDELAAHLTGDMDDLKYESFLLDRMEVYFATAGSESDLQFVEARILLLDEVDLYPPGAVKMAIDRSTTFWNRKIIKLSRPTTEDGHITQEYQRSDRRKFWVPCPHCGGYQVLSFWQIKHKGEKRGAWPRDLRDPEYIKGERVARYECLYCQGEIDDTNKPGMLARGKWVPEGHSIGRDGEMAKPAMVTHIGFWWSALYSPFKNFSEISSEFFETKEDPSKYRNFVTQWLAEPWKEIIKAKEASAILNLRTEIPPLVVPEGTVALTAAIDSQKRGFWVSIRAHRLDPVADSHLVRYGFLESFMEIEQWLFEDVYSSENGIGYPVWRAGIDTGGGEGVDGDPTITEQVYEWLRHWGRGRVFGIKGASRPLAGGKKMIRSLIERFPSGKPIPGGINLWILDTRILKDSVFARLEMGRFWVHKETCEVYAQHLTAEAKERDARGREYWRVQGRQPNHLLDCEVIHAAMADPECWGGIMVLPRLTSQGATVDQQPSGVNPVTGKMMGKWLGR